MQNKSTYKQAGPVPLCATPEEFNGWVEAGIREDKCVFCEDCLPGFQRDSIKVLRCENPTIRFFYEPPRWDQDRVPRARKKQSKPYEAGGWIRGDFDSRVYTDALSGLPVVDREIFSDHEIVML